MKYVVFMCHAIKILISTWARTRKFSRLLQAGKTVAFDFAHHGSLWSRSTSNFYTLIVKIWQLSSCRKFIQHLESCLLLCQLIMYLTVFFHCMYKMKFSCYQESSVLHGYLVFGWEIRLLSKSEILFRMASFSFFTLLDT